MKHPIIYIFGILAATLVTLALIILIMNPPMGDLVSLAFLLGITGFVSAGVGFVSHRMGWWRQLPTINQALTIGYILAAGLTLLNVLLAARQMFINQHDLALGSLLLVFASGISVAFGYFISSSITGGIRELARGAESLSEGDFSTRVPEDGRDEVAQLAQAFNRMVMRLEEAKQAELALDSARRNLIAWASHDLRTPLASLRAMIDAMAEGVVEDPETIERYLRQSQTEIARMSALIDNLFELAQIDAGHLELMIEPGSLSDLISDLLEGFSAQASARGISLTGSVSADVDPVWMAADKVSRVLDNLIVNALRHTEAQGRIEVRAELDNGSVYVEVSDTGSGIQAEDLPFIFDRFYRGEKSRSRGGYDRGGAGLGLAIAKGIIEAHGGTIGAESQPGMGTRMWFQLPRAQASQS